jgi:hypothetical protein
MRLFRRERIRMNTPLEDQLLAVAALQQVALVDKQDDAIYWSNAKQPNNYNYL